MALRRETIPDAHVWRRIADPAWTNPLDPSFAQREGGRWNPPDSFPTLYLDEDMATARRNLRTFIARWPPELRHPAFMRWRRWRRPVTLAEIPADPCPVLIAV